MEYVKLLSFVIIVLIVDIVCIYFVKLRSTAERKKKEKGDTLTIAFLHPDLGIGLFAKQCLQSLLNLRWC
jgi:hypothetical protein